MREDHWQGDWFQSYDVIPFLSIERLAAYVKRYEEFLKWPIMQPLVRHVTSSELWRYEADILQSVGPFVGNCRTSPHAPEIVALTKTIFNQDMLTVLLVNYGYFLLEAQANKFNDTMVGVVVNVALTFLSASLLLLTVPYSIQFFLHKTALLLKLPEMFRLMSRDRQVISNAVCANCNVLRYNKGLFRDIVNFLFQQLLLFSIRSMPKLVSPAGSLAISWLSMSAYPLEWLFTGQLLFGYPLFAAGLCQREVLINLQQYPELYIAMGATYHVTLFLLAESLSTFLKTTAFIGPYLLAMRPLFEGLGALPPSVYEGFLASFLTLFFVGLAHHVPFPKVVSQSTRYPLDFLTCLSADIVTEGATVLVKKRILSRATAFQKEMLAVKLDLFLFVRGIRDFSQQLVSEVQEVHAYLNESPFGFFMSEADVGLSKAWLLINALSKSSIDLWPKAIDLWVGALPLLLRQKEGLYQDKIIEFVLPKMLIDAHNLFNGLIQFRKRAKNLISWIKKIDAFFSSRKVKIICWLAGIKGVTDLFTLDFIVNQSPVYLDEVRGLVTTLHDYRIINRKIHDNINDEINAFKKHLVLIQKIIGGLPESFVEDLVRFIKNQQSEIYLRRGMAIVFEMLKKADPNLKSMGDEIIDEFVLLVDNKDECDFPEIEVELQSADFHRHFRAGSTISFFSGKPVISYVEDEDFTVVTQSSEVPSAQVFQPSGGRPVIVSVPSSDGFDSEDIPSDQEAFEKEFSGAAFKEKKSTTATSRQGFLTAMAATSKESLARVAEGFSPGLLFGRK